MSGPLSVDLRERVVSAWERGEGTQAEVAKRFGVGVASVVRWVALKRQTESLEPRPKPGRPRKLDIEHRAKLLELVKRRPDSTLAELSESLEAAGGPPTCISTISRELERAGWTCKKNAPRERG